MAYDKAVDSEALDQGLKQIADSIRVKTGSFASLSFPGGMVNAIDGIPMACGVEAVDHHQTADTSIRVNLKSGDGPVEVWGWGQYGSGFGAPVYLFLGKQYTDYIGGPQKPMAVSVNATGYLENLPKIDQGDILILRRE